MTETNENLDEMVTITKEESTPNPVDTFVPVLTGGGGAELNDFIGWDSTSIQEMTIVLPGDVSDKQFNDDVNTWTKKIGKAKSNQLNAVISEGLNLMTKTHAERVIMTGNVFNQLKQLVKRLDIPWVEWAEKNLTFISRRNRERCMMLANRADCYSYAFLGTDRLEMLCSATKNAKGKDPIGALLQSHDIDFDPEAETNLQEYKAKIDAALSIERLTQKGLNIDFNMMVNLNYIGVEINNTLINTLVNIQDSGGDPTKHLQQLVLTHGKGSADSDGAKKRGDFNSQSTRLIETIDSIIEAFEKEPASIGKLDRSTYAALLEKLEELNKIANLTDDDSE